MGASPGATAAGFIGGTNVCPRAASGAIERSETTVTSAVHRPLTFCSDLLIALGIPILAARAVHCDEAVRLLFDERENARVLRLQLSTESAREESTHRLVPNVFPLV
jgi:hypothetical protein